MFNRKAISITPHELSGKLTDFFQQNYHFVPKFDLYYNRGIWLPVVFDLKEENSEDYFSFLEKMYHDVFQLKDKHTGDHFELGDKLIQLAFDCETSLYLFEDAGNYYEQYIRGDEAMTHILMEENHRPKKIPKKIHTTKFQSIKERLARLLFTKADLDHTASLHAPLQSVYSELEDDSLMLTYEYEGKLITVLIYFETKPNSDALKKISIHVNALCESEDMYLKTKEIGQNVLAYFQNHPKYRLLNLYEDFIVCKNESEYKGSGSFSHPAFTELESVILSMRIDGFNYQEIGERIHVTSMIALQNMVKHIQQKITKYGINLPKKEEV